MRNVYVRRYDESGRGVDYEPFNRPYAAFDYIIFKDGDLVKAKSGRTGKVEFDGVDATKVIQSVIDALPTGGHIFICAGEYILHSMLQITSPVVLEGAGKYQTILKRADNTITTGTNDIIRINADNVIIKHLEIDGNFENNTPDFASWNSPNDYDASGINTAGHSNIILEGLYVHDTVRSNLILAGENIVVKDVLLKNAWGDHHIYVTANSKHVVCEKLDVSGSASGESIVVGTSSSSRADYVTLNNVYIHDFAAGFDYSTHDLTNYPYRALSLRDSAGNYTMLGNVTIIDTSETGSQIYVGHDTVMLRNIFISTAVSATTTTAVYASQNVQNLLVNDLVIQITTNYRGATVYAMQTFAQNNEFNNLHIVTSANYVRALEINSSGNVVRANISNATIDVTEMFLRVSADSNPAYVNLSNVHLKNAKNILPTGTYAMQKSNVDAHTNAGTATFSGDGSTTQFTIPHGLVSTPSKVQVTPMSADAVGDFYVTVDSTNIYVNYTTAPPAGTDNIKLSWYAEV